MITVQRDDLLGLGLRGQAGQGLHRGQIARRRQRAQALQGSFLLTQDGLALARSGILLHKLN